MEWEIYFDICKFLRNYLCEIMLISFTYKQFKKVVVEVFPFS